MYLRRLGSNLLAGFAFLLASLGVGAADLRTPDQPAEDVAPGYLVPLMYDPQFSDHRVPPPPEFTAGAKDFGKAAATFQINYVAAGVSNTFGSLCQMWPPEAQTAFNFAANIWSSLLQSSVPIVVEACWTNLGPGILGSAGPRTFYRDFPGAPVAGTWYPKALANALRGLNSNAALPDIVAQFSSTFSWYFGTNGQPGAQLDFVSVVLHELGHGLGFLGAGKVSGGLGSWDLSATGFPAVYDRATEDNAGTAILAYPNNSTQLAATLQSNAVFFDAPNAKAANGNARVPLYAPATFNSGSSYSHLAESFNGTSNALMTFSLSSGESIQNPGPVALAMFKDMSWVLNTVTPPATADLALTQTASVNPASTGKDVVFTMNLSNAGPGAAASVVVMASYDPAATVIWATPGCTPAAAGIYQCPAGTVASGATAQYKLVLRKSAAGSIYNNAGVTSSTTDPNPANNSPTIGLVVNASPAGAQVPRYRLFSPVTSEHLFTTSLAEYNALGALVGTWVQEGTVGKVLNNPGSFNGVTATPYYRLYNTSNAQHHWTTDANEYYTLGLFPQYSLEGVDGWILPTQAAGTVPLYRLLYPFSVPVAGLHHWTIDPVEYGQLISVFGWIGEGGSGFVIP